MSKIEFIKAMCQQDNAKFSPKIGSFELIICVGVFFGHQNKKLLDEIINSDAKLVCLSPMEELKLSERCDISSRYEVGSEEGVMALLVKNLLAKAEVPEKLKEYFEAFDEGYLSAESNVGEEEIEEIVSLYDEAQSVLLILGEELTKHKRAANIAHLAGALGIFGKVAYKIDGASEDEMKANPTCPNLTEIDSISSFDGVVVYECLAQNKDEEKYLIGTKQFSMAARVSQNDRVSFEFNGALEDRIFICDENQKGVIALVPRLNRSENYPYSVVKVAKVNQ